MSFSIIDFLKLDVVKTAKVVTNDDTIRNKLIESISVMELPVENFVHKYELVLTTCIGCTDDDSVFLDFVKDIYNSGASGLVVSIGRYVKRTPKNVIDYANEVGFPIIELPWEIRFASIIESVLFEINNVKQAYLKLFESIQKKLLTLYLNGSTLSEAANLIYEELGNAAVIANTLGSVQGASKDSDDLLKSIEGPLNILFSGKNLEQLKSFDMKDVYTVYKIGSKNMTYGYLYLKSKSHEINNDYVRGNKTLIIRHIVSAISLWFDREQTIFETEMHHKDKFVWNLVQADENELKELYTQANSIGYNLSVPYICIVGMVSNFEKSYDLQRANFSSFEEWKYNCIKSIKSQILRVGQTIDQEIMLTYQEERLIIFLESKDDDYEKISNQFIDIIESRIKPIYPKLVISWGIGAYKADYLHFKKAYLDAKISLQFGHNEKDPGFRYIYYNTSIYRLLSILLNDNETHEIVKNIVGGLVEYDKENGLDLINTFKSYTKNDGNVSQTARELHLHRQSLLYRLKRVEEITQMSLDNSDDIFLLELCIRLWDKKNDLII
ncbi:MAG: PucR family transcriptional regulator ligand-binding domain-containing protein [Tissierellaceae bacterium]|nr:PucR family transcriptional regulator ligand-binding domain-containing protein [Tissierellaceae bacterium]